MPEVFCFPLDRCHNGMRQGCRCQDLAERCPRGESCSFAQFTCWVPASIPYLTHAASSLLPAVNIFKSSSETSQIFCLFFHLFYFCFALQLPPSSIVTTPSHKFPCLFYLTLQLLATCWPGIIPPTSKFLHRKPSQFSTVFPV